MPCLWAPHLLSEGVEPLVKESLSYLLELELSHTYHHLSKKKEKKYFNDLKVTIK